MRSAAFLLGQDILVYILRTAAGVVMARWLGPAALGLLNIVNLIPDYAEKLGRVGSADHAAVYLLGQKRFRLNEISGPLILISLVLALLPALFYLFFQDFFRVYFLKTNAMPSAYLWTAVASIPFTYLTISASKLMLSQRLIAGYNWVQIVRACLFLLFCAGSWAFGLDLYGALLGNLLSVAAGSILGLWFLSKATNFSFRLRGDVVRGLFGYGWKMYAIGAFSFFQQRFDLVIVAYYLSPSEVAYYSIATVIGELLLKAPNAIASLLYPEVSRKSYRDAVWFTACACRNSWTLLCLGAFCLALAAGPLVGLFFGPSFLPLIKPLWILLPGFVAMGLANILREHFYGQGHPRIIFYGIFLCSTVNVGANLVFTPVYGLQSAALIATITYFLNALWLTCHFLSMWPEGSLSRLLFIDRDDMIRYGIFFRSLFWS